MIRLSAMYSAGSGSKFDWTTEAADAVRLVTHSKQQRFGSVPAGYIPAFPRRGSPFLSVMADVERAMAQTASDLIADPKKYFNGESLVQVNEAVEA